MTALEQELTRQFYRFEIPGRGGLVYPEPVAVEPPFRPFAGYRLPRPAQRDDGRRHTFFSRLMESLGQAMEEPFAAGSDEETEEEQLQAVPWERLEVVELRMTLPRERKGFSSRMESLLGALALCESPVSFEVLGTSDGVTLQMAANPEDIPLIERQLALLFPSMVVSFVEDALADAWLVTGSSYAVCEFGLEREFMLPLGIPSTDPLLPLLSALSALDENELGIFQLIFESVRHAWGHEALLAASDGEGGSFFVNRPELLTGAKAKFTKPLYGALLRMASSAETSDRAWRIVAEMASGFVADAGGNGNRLIPLSNDHYPSEEHEQDLMFRQSRRSGMLLNRDELLWLFRLPEDAVSAQLLSSDDGSTYPAPETALESTDLCIGLNEHGGGASPAFLTDENRFRHTHILGASGTGKSTLLLSLIRQDIESGAGVGVLDPHGDLIRQILGVIPAHRIQDVVLIDPSDEESVVGFNILSAHSDLEKTLLASDLVAIFARLSSSWGDQMNSVFQNAILAFLESTQGGTLADLRRFLLDKDFRASFLKTVTDPEAVFYWEKGFPQLGGNKSIGPILTRLESFLSPKSIRYMVSQKSNRLDFAEIMNGRKILLACLPQGLMGRENSYLLGSLLVAKFQLTAMSRQSIPERDRQPFWLYIDEFQNFATPSMSEILSGARKYKLGMTLAHQDLAQLKRHPELMSSVLTNTYTRIVFRPGDEDAQSMAAGFAHFDTKALMSLSVGKAICRIGRNDADFNLKVPFPDQENSEELDVRRQEVIEASRRQYGRSKAEVAFEMAQISERAAKPTLPNRSNDTSPADSSPIAVTPNLELGTPSSLPEKEDVIPPKAESIAIEAKPSKRGKPEVPSGLGVGGEVHTSIQRELKLVAESLGFRATIEKQLPGTLQSTDLLLERESVTLAVEVTVTNTLDYELKNIGKCLRAGVSMVAVVGPDPAKLRKLEDAAAQTYAPHMERLFGFLSAEEFVERLQQWVLLPPPSDKTEPQTQHTSHKGWKVKTTGVEASVEDMKEREAEVVKILLGHLKAPKKP